MNLKTLEIFANPYKDDQATISEAKNYHDWNIKEQMEQVRKALESEKQ